MRIEAYHKLNQIYKSDKTNGMTQATASSKNDKLEISQQGLDYQIAKKAVADTKDTRAELVNRLKSEIKTGSYHVSEEDFASKVIENYNKLMY